jgi:lipopolysaccharide export LptBFGC system permease protein LptF
MKTLDRYVAKNFAVGYVIAFSVLIGLRIIIDLFVNLDEFAEHADLGTLAVLKNIFIFYGINSTIYFRDFAGMITVVAAAFSLGKMVRCNELVAMMASGVSLKRVIGPIVLLALLLTVLLVVDQEFIIPRLANKLVRDQDYIPGRESYSVWFMSDSSGSLICSRRFDVETSTLYQPTIITRSKIPKSTLWEVTGRISAEKAVYNTETKQWDLYSRNPETGKPSSSETSVDEWVPYGLFTGKDAEKSPQKISSYASDIIPKDIPIRRKSEYKALLGWRELAALAAQGTKIKDRFQLYSQKHFRVTDPIINLVMLLVCLPILVCRDPKSMKTAIMLSFAMVGVCFITTFICRMFAPEAHSFFQIGFWAWVPVFVFAPIAFIELDSMKT